MKKNKDNLKRWQDRLSAAQSAYESELSLMSSREAKYKGSKDIESIVSADRAQLTTTPHVRNICAELVEAQVNSSIPQPKVTARRKQDEYKAKLIEDMLRNELDRLPVEQINDMMERTVPIQGGGLLLLEWDNTLRTHTTTGELSLSTLHPSQVIPQDGVFSGVEDMDYIIVKIPQTKDYIERKYGVTVDDESEAEPDIRGAEASAAADLVTQYIAYYRNDNGGIGLYSWVGDTELEDLEDYQARKLRRCSKCGAVEPLESTPLNNPTLDGNIPEQGEKPAKKGSCPHCGANAWETSDEDYEEIYEPITLSDGKTIGGATLGYTEEMAPDGGVFYSETLTPARIPYYKPNVYPIILQKNVSVHGKFLGDSDIDKIASQQNTINRLEAKIIQKLCESGSYFTYPAEARVPINELDAKRVPVEQPSDMQRFAVFDLEGNIEQDLAYLAQVYEEARQIIGITDSFQGRADRTATSGKAKEFAAAQSAGRLESKRVMKDAAYAQLFEAMFKFKLAYTDEPRPVVSSDNRGNAVYEEFNRYDFLEVDEAGEYWWNDQFLFSCDTTAPLANNREAMWQETRMNLQTGAFGDPTRIETLILFWTKMELLHYPGASDTKTYLEEELQRQMQQAQMQMQQAQMRQQMQQVINQAQQDAARDMAAGNIPQQAEY